MITRAQAEALLTLAESLEACERQGQFFNFYPVGRRPDGHSPLGQLEGGPLRSAADLFSLLSAIITKQDI
jgi:hypothetical protein